MRASILTNSRAMRGMNSRLRGLKLFAGKAEGKWDGQASTVWWQDHPLLQVVLERRDQYQRVQRQAERLEEELDLLPEDAEARERIQAIVAVAKTAQVAEQHLGGLQDAIVDAMGEIGRQVGVDAKLVSDYARLRQKDQHHLENMQTKTGKKLAAPAERKIDPVPRPLPPGRDVPDINDPIADEVDDLRLEDVEE